MLKLATRVSPGSPFQYVDISSVDATHKRISGARTMLGKDAPSRARQVVNANDILVATTRPNLNAVALVPAELDDEVCSTGFCVLRPTSEIDPLFPFFFVQTNDFVRLVSGEVRGMLYPAVTDGQVRAISIPLPPLPEQKRIATEVQDLMKEVEHARIACEAQLEAAKALPQAYLRQVFESEEAKKWERKRLGEMAKADTAKVLPDAYDIKQLPYVGLEHIESETGRIIGTLIGNGSALVQSTTFRFDTRHVLYGKLRPYLNKVAVPNFKGRCTTELLPLLPLTGCDRRYLAWLLRRSETVGEAIRHMTGTRMPRVDIDELFSLTVPVPPLPEQERIAIELDKQMSNIENLKASTEKQLEAIKALPQAILRQAFRGQL